MRLAVVAVPLMTAAVIEDAIAAGQDARPPLQIAVRPARREAVESARLNQTFEHLLVHQAQIEMLGQREQRCDFAHRLAGGEQRADRAFAGALDSTETEAHTL